MEEWIFPFVRGARDGEACAVDVLRAGFASLEPRAFRTSRCAGPATHGGSLAHQPRTQSWPRGEIGGRVARNCGTLCEDLSHAWRGGLSSILFGQTGKPTRRDRKSTRLNSTPTLISYALLFFKKKNKNTTT